MRKPRLVEEHEAAGKRIVVDGQHIFVREEGEGEPVLLLHGVPSSSFLFRKMLPLNAQFFERGCVVDRAGCAGFRWGGWFCCHVSTFIR